MLAKYVYRYSAFFWQRTLTWLLSNGIRELHKTFIVSSTPQSHRDKRSASTTNAIEMQPFAGEILISRSNAKNVEATVTEEDESELKGSTANDRRDMDRLGKKQELRV